MADIIATPGAVDANSFVTLPEFNTYLGERLHLPAVVTSADDQTKIKALIIAARALNSRCFLGAATSSTQRLKFPRTGLFTSTGYALASNIIPQELKDAQMELAILFIQSDRTLENPVEVAGLTKLKAGPVELGFKEGIKVNLIPDSVIGLLPSSWLCPDPDAAKKSIILETL